MTLRPRQADAGRRAVVGAGRPTRAPAGERRTSSHGLPGSDGEASKLAASSITCWAGQPRYERRRTAGRARWSRRRAEGDGRTDGPGWSSNSRSRVGDEGRALLEAGRTRRRPDQRTCVRDGGRGERPVGGRRASSQRRGADPGSCRGRPKGKGSLTRCATEGGEGEGELERRVSWLNSRRRCEVGPGRRRVMWRVRLIEGGERPTGNGRDRRRQMAERRRARQERGTSARERRVLWSVRSGRLASTGRQAGSSDAHLVSCLVRLGREGEGWRGKGSSVSSGPAREAKRRRPRAAARAPNSHRTPPAQQPFPRRQP